ncbi:amidohydrolase family protein [Streptomyces sp. NPDC057242]|uniref:amidohydrolase family protein n=1 Tax=unclassified Streptomyces TaxID=2593676 RepID=UPI0036324132
MAADSKQPQPPGEGAAAGAGPTSLLLSHARLADGRTVDVRLVGERIEAVGTAGSLAPVTPGARVDLTGHLLLPAPAEPHAHPDGAFSADRPGPVPYDGEEVRRRATEAALLQLGHGATALRAHVRIGDDRGLGPLEAVLRVQGSLHGLGTLTPVAVPRLLGGAAGAEGRALLRDAVRRGAGAVGGRPDLDPDPVGHVAAVLEVAAEHGVPVDLHAEGDDPAWLARLAAMAGELGTGVTIGPCAGLARLPPEVAGRAAERLAAAGVAVVCLPQGGCADAGTGDGGPRGVAPVRLLRAAGVRVAAGSGALRDAANPVGRGDPLEAAYLLASQGGLSPEEAYGAVSAEARAVMGLPEVRVEAGFPAELLAVRGERLAGALSLAYSRIVVHRGRVVARTSAVREYCDSAAALDLPRQARTRRPPGPGSPPAGPVVRS